jgi:hypothetical protein
MGSPGVARRSKPLGGVAGFPWNQWQLSPGIGGSFAMESVATFVWNRWQLCYGISGSFPVESVAGLAWNTHYSANWHREMALWVSREIQHDFAGTGKKTTLFLSSRLPLL